MGELDLNALMLSPETVATRLIRDVALLGDEELRARLHGLNLFERGAEAAFIAHLAEFDARELYKKLGYGSLFTYCLDVCGHSEARAYKRIRAARASRRFPIILERLAAGRLNVTGVAILSPHLTAENIVGVLDAAEKLRKFELERLAATLAPRPEPKDVVRRLPAVPTNPAHPAADSIISACAAQASPETVRGAPVEMPPAEGAEAASEGIPAPPAAPAGPKRSERITPLSAERVRFCFTGGEALRVKLERVRGLMWHKEPEGRLEAVVEALADDFLARKDPLRRPARAGRARARQRVGPRLRRIPAAVRREVWARDGGACAFEGVDGSRCGETRGLEVDHILPFARGGSSEDPANLRLLCRSHNQWVAREAGLPRPDACRRPPAEGTPP